MLNVKGEIKLVDFGLSALGSIFNDTVRQISFFLFDQG